MRITLAIFYAINSGELSMGKPNIDRAPRYYHDHNPALSVKQYCVQFVHLSMKIISFFINFISELHNLK